ncbi:hypothetical protein [Streptomyces mangrovisoli]|uniref:Uncharacterized protein n=1 Tax=Streptomyces mangrovisoli TaxID=1428628 RepID=A0A1J4P3Y8_9ACTN|nr:hypothetical protein [Streptomyces mangrovisoli]OIJ68930.1 hypothetical protein WN71_005590 [Streptomyces mangrovisoli]
MREARARRAVAGRDGGARRRGGLFALTALLVVAPGVAGCRSGDDIKNGPVYTDSVSAPATPYSGPLYVPVRAKGATGVDASGASGRALECDGRMYSGGRSDPWSRGDGGSTPVEGLLAYFDMEQPDVPRSGYRVERREHDRVLFSYDVAGRTKVAVIVAKDRPDRPGWGPETSASCDPSEFPAKVAESLGYEVWTDRDGHRLPVTEVRSDTGPGHCGWESAHFLELDGKREYASDPHGVLPSEMLTAPYRANVKLPADAHDTGYRFRGRQLWLTDDRSTAYVRVDGRVQAWPEVKEGVACQ